jgi:hypothetical protein
MSLFVTVTEGEEQNVVPNGIKGALFDPRFSKMTQEKLGAALVKVVNEAIVTDTLMLVDKRSKLNWFKLSWKQVWVLCKRR